MTTTEPAAEHPEGRTALLDINVLIALAWPNHVHHQLAHRWLTSIGSRPWATTLITELGFVRLSSNASVVGSRAHARSAIRALAAIRLVPGHCFIADNTSLLSPVIGLDRLATGRQVTDVHLVNLCAANDAQLMTLDRGIPSYLAEADRHHVQVLTV